MSYSPLVSVIVPCYNHADFLADSLTGLLEQDYENVELLICDDCSTDKSAEIIRSYEEALRAKFQNLVLLFNEENYGLTKNLNRMLKQAKGEYIKLIASDDVLTRNAISKLVSCFAENPTAGVVVCNGVKISEDQHYGAFQPMTAIYEEAPDFSPCGFLERTIQRSDIFAPGAMVKSSLYEMYGDYDESIAVEDLEYWLRLIKNNIVFCYCPEKLIYYRVNTESMTSKVNSANLEKRRRRFYGAVAQTLEKYRREVSANLYADVCMYRNMGEQSFAVDLQLKNWERDLRKEMVPILLGRDLQIQKKIYYAYRFFRMQLRKIRRCLLS